jgi:hypothetical protein
MKNHGSVFLPKPHKNSTTESNDNEFVEIADSKFRSLLLKKIQ